MINRYAKELLEKIGWRACALEGEILYNDNIIATQKKAIILLELIEEYELNENIYMTEKIKALDFYLNKIASSSNLKEAKMWWDKLKEKTQ